MSLKNKSESIIRGKSTGQLLKEILNYKLNTTSKRQSILNFFIIVILSSIVTYSFNFFNIKTTVIKEFLIDLLNLAGVLVGFSLTALTIVGTNLHEKLLKLSQEIKSKSYPKLLIWDVLLYEFFGYVYSLLISLIFIITSIFIFPYVYYFVNYRWIISFVFFLLLFLLLFYNCWSVKSLIYNLYGLFLLNAKATTISEKKGT